VPNIQIEIPFPTEIWKPVKCYEGLYSISNLGRLKSHERTVIRGRNAFQTIQERILKVRKSKYGYLWVGLHNGRLKNFAVHCLVAKTFIPNPENKRTINHKDGNKLNNHVSNLEWATYSENHLHAFHVLGRKANSPMKGKFSKDCPNSKPIVQLTLGGEFVKRWDCISDVERTLGFNRKCISACANGKRNHAYAHEWRYL
jgi:hypothetical protein